MRGGHIHHVPSLWHDSDQLTRPCLVQCRSLPGLVRRADGATCLSSRDLPTRVLASAKCPPAPRLRHVVRARSLPQWGLEAKLS